VARAIKGETTMSIKVKIVDIIPEDSLPANLLQEKFLDVLCDVYSDAAFAAYPGAVVEMDIDIQSGGDEDVEVIVMVFEDGKEIDCSEIDGKAKDLCDYLSTLAWPLLKNDWLYETEGDE
jgi:hypothetical protein